MNERQREQAELLFRRRRFEAPHRRRHPVRRLARPLAGALGVVGLPAALVWWILTSPQLAIREIQAVSTGRVTQEWLETRLETLRGRHLLALRLEEVESCLAEHPWIAAVVVRRQLPGRLEVTVRERRPAALWNDGGELFFLDAGGRSIAPLDAGYGDVDLPVLHGPMATQPLAMARAIQVATAWERLRPDDKVSEIELLRSGDYRLVTNTLPFAVVVSADRIEAAPAALARALPLIRHYPGRPAAVDLRFSRQIVFQPAALPPREEG